MFVNTFCDNFIYIYFITFNNPQFMGIFVHFDNKPPGMPYQALPRGMEKAGKCV